VSRKLGAIHRETYGSGQKTLAQLEKLSSFGVRRPATKGMSVQGRVGACHDKDALG